MTTANIETNESIIYAFLESMAKTASQHDLHSHMDLISKEVEVIGVPGFEVIDFKDWSSQCEKEFNDKLINQISYENIRVMKSADSCITFRTIEHIEASDGTKNTTGVEIIITKEIDGKWRITQENILSNDELAALRYVS